MGKIYWNYLQLAFSSLQGPSCLRGPPDCESRHRWAYSLGVGDVWLMAHTTYLKGMCLKTTQIDKDKIDYILYRVYLICFSLHFTKLCSTVNILKILLFTALNETAQKVAALYYKALHWTETDWNELKWVALHCNDLKCIALHCAALNSTLLHCTALRWIKLHWTNMYHTPLRCTTLYCTALHCTVFHYNAVTCMALHCTGPDVNPSSSSPVTSRQPWVLADSRNPLHCTALHCTALHRTALHYTALHCSVTLRCPLQPLRTIAQRRQISRMKCLTW